MEVSGRKGATCKSMEQSTEEYKQLCSPCSADGHNQYAGVYCSNCSEYLCPECCKIHRKVTLTKHHVLLDKTDMPQGRRPPTTARDGREDELMDPCPIHTDKVTEYHCKHHNQTACSACVVKKHRTCAEINYIPNIATTARDGREDELMDLCPIHADKVTEYHCKDHNQTACSACVVEKHRTCAEVNYIPNIAKGIADSQECKDIEKSVNELTDKVNSIELQMAQTVADIKKASTDYIHAVRSYRVELVAIIDKLVNDAEAKMQAYVDSVTCQLINDREVNQTYVDMLGSVQADISDNIQTVCEKKLFVKLKHAETLIAECKEYISTIEKDTHVNACRFEKNSMLYDQLSSCESIGELVTKTWPYLSDEVNVKAPTDTKTCDITGMVILEDGRLVLTDFDNRSVKLFDTNHKLISCFPLNSRPYDIAKVRTAEVAVGMGDNKGIQFLSVGKSLTLGPVINTAVSCYSVACYGDRLLVCTYMSKEVVMLDMGGRKVHTVWTCPVGYPWLIRLHPDNKQIYVSHNSGVTCLNQAGKVLGEYININLWQPCALAIHPDGSVYVSGVESHSIHHRTADCTKIEILCDGQVVDPRSICYNHMDNTLYVSELKKDKVKLFKLCD